MAAERNTGANRRLIIHCGVQKTASTSLHHFVGRNRDRLQPLAEILTPVKGSPTRALGRAAMQFSLDPSAAREARFVDLIRGLRGQLATGTVPALISHENLPGAMIGKGGVTTLYPRLEQIMTLLDTHFAPMLPEYVLYTRDMGAWKRSVYNQAVKSDSYARPRAAFETETADCGSWDGLGDRMRAQVGPDRVRFFRVEDESEPGKPGLQLLRHAGLSEADIAALSPLAGRRNPSLNAGALEFLRLVNGLGLERKARAGIAELVTANQSLFVAGGA